MWLFLNDAFLSVVDKGDPSRHTLLVRGRRPGDIERVFPDAKVTEGEGTDYRFRARLPREAVAQRFADAARQIDYGNFKGSVDDQERHDAYMKVWEAMYRYQERVNRGPTH